jgi:hypothetical protein
VSSYLRKCRLISSKRTFLITEHTQKVTVECNIFKNTSWLSYFRTVIVKLNIYFDVMTLTIKHFGVYIGLLSLGQFRSYLRWALRSLKII